MLTPPMEYYQDDTNPDALKILFIGNSLTFTNDLPLVLLRFLSSCSEPPKTGISLGHGFKFYTVMQGGFRLEDHWNYKVASKCIRESGPWDYVVLQEQSATTANQDYDITQHAQLFAEEIKAIGAKTALFAIWSFRSDPEANIRVAVRQTELAAQLDAIKVPVGDCWTRLREKHPEIELYADDIHPSPAGTYLAACAFYVTLTGLSPVGLPIEIKYLKGDALITLSEEQGLIIQELVQDVLLS